MKQFAVLYVTPDTLTSKWDILYAENARAAAKKVREQNPICTIWNVFKLVDKRKWN